MFGIYKKPTERIFYPTVWMWEISLHAFHKYSQYQCIVRIQKSIVLLINQHVHTTHAASTNHVWWRQPRQSLSRTTHGKIFLGLGTRVVT